MSAAAAAAGVVAAAAAPLDHSRRWCKLSSGWRRACRRMQHSMRAALRRWCAWWSTAGGCWWRQGGVGCSLPSTCSSQLPLLLKAAPSAANICVCSATSRSRAPQHHVRMGGGLPRRGGPELGWSGRAHVCGAPAHAGPQTRQVSGGADLGHASCALFAPCSSQGLDRVASCQSRWPVSHTTRTAACPALQPPGAGARGGLRPGTGGAVQCGRAPAPVRRGQPQHTGAEPRAGRQL